jgi:hypothetical protein
MGSSVWLSARGTPDVAFVRGDRFPNGLPAEFIEGAPDLAGERVLAMGDGLEAPALLHDFALPLRELW